MSDFKYIVEDGKVVNPYEPGTSEKVIFPPEHMGQAWETFDPASWDKDAELSYAGQREGHAVYGIQLFELIDDGLFDWSKPELDWKDAAYDDDQHARLCAYFIERFRFREIGIVPYLEWAYALRRMLVYELMPKYKPLYEQVASGISPLGENEYYKERHISSLYPETLLSGNSDYVSSGEDREYERVKVANAADAMERFKASYESVDKMLCDELEVLFTCTYTSYANVL